MEYLLAFGSTHKVLLAESFLKEVDIAFRLLPAPKELTVRCELVISIKDRETLGDAIKTLSKSTAPHVAIYVKKRGEYLLLPHLPEEETAKSE